MSQLTRVEEIDDLLTIIGFYTTKKDLLKKLEEIEGLLKKLVFFGCIIFWFVVISFKIFSDVKQLMYDYEASVTLSIQKNNNGCAINNGVV
jgi:hypothetical protein